MGSGHHHGQDTGEPAPRAVVRAVLAVLVPLAVATLAGLVWLWPSGEEPRGEEGVKVGRATGTITSVTLKPCQEATPGSTPLDLGEPGVAPFETDPRRCGTATVRLESGKEKGTTARVELPSGPGSQVFAEGDDVVLLEMPGGTLNGDRYHLSDHDRSEALWLIAVAFVLAVIAFGRWRGLRALAGLGITFALLVFFLLPAILEGRPPLLVAVVCASAIMLAVLYLTHGFTVTTSVAVLGTLASLVLAGALATAVLDLTHLSGITDDSSLYLDANYQINTRGLLLASILIGALGVLDDVTVTQSATVRELAGANPRYGFRELYRAGARVGRAHIASVINTIVLAYAGASLPLLLLFELGGQGAGQVLTNPVIAQEIVRSVVGTLGLIAAVPLTTALAAFAASRGTPAAPAEEPSGDTPRPKASWEWEEDPEERVF
ncbi:YibE/F family protein [Actinocorallia sp. B10E7]|uniref:YibE/F family protein n=1 Tax=Actinocorallia sp. B10E7 TaxID=3153558 RepID=UPI00325DBCD2